MARPVHPAGSRSLFSICGAFWQYIHLNPVKRGDGDDPVHWRYSSARNYAGLPGLVNVITDWC
jgi:hypothetical protein